MRTMLCSFYRETHQPQWNVIARNRRNALRMWSGGGSVPSVSIWATASVEQISPLLYLLHFNNLCCVNTVKFKIKYNRGLVHATLVVAHIHQVFFMAVFIPKHSLGMTPGECCSAGCMVLACSHHRLEFGWHFSSLHCHRE